MYLNFRRLFPCEAFLFDNVYTNTSLFQDSVSVLLPSMLKICLTAALLRLFFIIYGHFHDQLMEVKYTDIDYFVFTKASEFIFNGSSPYMKDTYKYTPILAYMLLPNIFFNIYFGKVLFCLFDLLVGYFQMKILENYISFDASKVVSLFWLFNPFTMTISSRGNAEAILLFLVVLMFYFILKNNYLLGGIFYGLSVHFKIYPVIYGLPIFLFILLTSTDKRNVDLKISKEVLVKRIYDIFVFGLSAVGSFFFIGMIMYHRFGDAFIQESYLFHFNRTDMQHNFSPYFYVLLKYQSDHWLFKAFSFLPQFIVVFICGVKYYQSLPFACFMQTFAFVSFNKVCTSQYFIWYIGLIPLIAPYVKIGKRKACFMFLIWIYGQMVWLFLAYLYEFKNMDVLFYVWLASVQFFIINVYLLYEFGQSYEPFFKQRKIQ